MFLQASVLKGLNETWHGNFSVSGDDMPPVPDSNRVFDSQHEAITHVVNCLENTVRNFRKMAVEAAAKKGFES